MHTRTGDLGAFGQLKSHQLAKAIQRMLNMMPRIIVEFLSENPMEILLFRKTEPNPANIHCSSLVKPKLLRNPSKVSTAIKYCFVTINWLQYPFQWNYQKEIREITIIYSILSKFQTMLHKIYHVVDANLNEAEQLSLAQQSCDFALLTDSLSPFAFWIGFLLPEVKDVLDFPK